jgi:hypothetical protein
MRTATIAITILAITLGLWATRALSDDTTTLLKKSDLEAVSKEMLRNKLAAGAYLIPDVALRRSIANLQPERAKLANADRARSTNVDPSLSDLIAQDAIVTNFLSTDGLTEKTNRSQFVPVQVRNF